MDSERSRRVMSLKVLLLLLALSTLPLAQTPPDAGANNAPRVQNPTPASPAEPSKWERYTYPGEEFSVELPEMPFVLKTTRHVNRTLSDFEGMRVYGVYSGVVVFMIVSYDKPRNGETFDDFAGYPWGGRSENMVSKDNVTLKGFAGKEYQRQDGLDTARVFRAKKHAYLVKAISRNADHASVTRFFESFDLDAKPSGVAINEYQVESARVSQPPPDGSSGPVRGSGVGSGDGGGIGPGRGSNASVGDPKEGGPAPRIDTIVDYDRAFRQNEVTRKAVIVYKPEPGYTEEARKNNVTGVVRLRVVLSSSGKVTNISVIKSLPDGLTVTAIYAARRMLFLPANKDGRDVSQFVILEYNYNIY
jgi:TonB family protein